MTKIINFTATCILPELLKFFETKGKEGKSQTIRPKWKYKNYYSGQYAGMTIKEDKPPRFKVGEKAKIQWCQRSKYQWFDRRNGLGISNESIVKEEIFTLNLFNKTLGIVTISEVFEIEMGRRDSFEYITINGNEYSFFDATILNLAIRDGFEDQGKMFQYFDNAYDLSKSPKPFYVYRWK